MPGFLSALRFRSDSALAMPMTATRTVPATLRPMSLGARAVTAVHAVTRMGTVHRRPVNVMGTMNIARPVDVRVIHTAIGLVDIGITVAIAVPGTCGVAAR